MREGEGDGWERGERGESTFRVGGFELGFVVLLRGMNEPRKVFPIYRRRRHEMRVRGGSVGEWAR